MPILAYYLLITPKQLIRPVLVQSILETIHWRSFDHMLWQSVPVKTDNSCAEERLSNSCRTPWQQDQFQTVSTQVMWVSSQLKEWLTVDCYHRHQSRLTAPAAAAAAMAFSGCHCSMTLTRLLCVWLLPSVFHVQTQPCAPQSVVGYSRTDTGIHGRPGHNAVHRLIAWTPNKVGDDDRKNPHTSCMRLMRLGSNNWSITSNLIINISARRRA